MPVHFTVASHDAQPVKALATIKRPTKPEELLDSTWGIEAGPIICAELLQSSFVSKELELFTVLSTANYSLPPQIFHDINAVGKFFCCYRQTLLNLALIL